MIVDAMHGTAQVDGSAPRRPLTREHDEPDRQGSPYSRLSREVKAADLLRRRPGYYTLRITLVCGLLAAGWVLFVAVGNSWWQLATAAFLAVMFTQTAFIGHDAGHRQVFSSRRANDALGLLCGNLLVGLSFGWWVTKHNRHHSHPNQVERDPDINPGAFVFAPGDAHGRRGAARWLTRHQAGLFFPMLLLEGLNLHVASGRELASRRGRGVVAEAALLVAHVAAYLAVVAAVLPPVKALVFVLAQQALFGLYMGCAFAPNHKGMPILTRDEPDFLLRQVLTARNIRGGRFTDILFGGLNYQIEHHLFPSMPSSNLRRAQPLVRGFCRSRGVTYRERGILGSYREGLRHLRDVGAPLRPDRIPALRSDPDAGVGGRPPGPGSRGARE